MSSSEANKPQTKEFCLEPAICKADPNRELVRRALQYVASKREIGDEEITAMLRNYTIRSAIFNYEAMPDMVISQLMFRVEMPENIQRAVRIFRTLDSYIDLQCHNASDDTFWRRDVMQKILIEFRAAIEQFSVPAVCADDVEMSLYDRDEEQQTVSHYPIPTDKLPALASGFGSKT